MILISIHDRVTGEFSSPYTFVNNDDMKRRICESERNNPFLNDLDVYRCGSYDPKLGVLTPTEGGLPEFIFTVQSLYEVT